MRLLDLFCGAGGAAMGYHQAGFEVVGVDIAPQPHYPFAFLQMDALNALATLIAGGSLDFGGQRLSLADFILLHASPPCQAYTGMRRLTVSRWGRVPEHPDLIAAVRSALQRTAKIYIIENVQGAPLYTQIILCGASLGLAHLARHRHFESNIMLFTPPCQHRKNEYTIGVYGSRPDGRRVSYRQHRLCRVASSLQEAQREMGIDWMDWPEITQAIPPVYTEYIGQQVIAALRGQP